jgi:hypothetical protein
MVPDIFSFAVFVYIHHTSPPLLISAIHVNYEILRPFRIAFPVIDTCRRRYFVGKYVILYPSPPTTIWSGTMYSWCVYAIGATYGLYGYMYWIVLNYCNVVKHLEAVGPQGLLVNNIIHPSVSQIDMVYKVREWAQGIHKDCQST